MRFLILLILLVGCKSSKVDDNNHNTSVLSEQGYLFVEVDDSKDLNTIKIDNIRRYFFVPQHKLKASLEETFDFFSKPIQKDFYVPISLTSSDLSIAITENKLKKIYFKKDFELKPIKERDSFNQKLKTRFEFKSNTANGKKYYVVYIDGLWSKFKIPGSSAMNIIDDLYKLNSVNLNHDFLNFYFLKDLNTISYDPDIKDSTIIIIEMQSDRE